MAGSRHPFGARVSSLLPEDDHWGRAWFNDCEVPPKHLFCFDREVSYTAALPVNLQIRVGDTWHSPLSICGGSSVCLSLVYPVAPGPPWRWRVHGPCPGLFVPPWELWYPQSGDLVHI